MAEQLVPAALRKHAGHAPEKSRRHGRIGIEHLKQKGLIDTEQFHACWSINLRRSSLLWIQYGADIHGEEAEDKSGSSVSLSSDGNTVAIGAPRNSGNGADSGHVRVIDLTAPVIDSAAYDASTGRLVVKSFNLKSLEGDHNDIDLSKLTITGEGGYAHALTTTVDVEIDSATQFSAVLNAVDQLQLSGLLNNNGTASAGKSSSDNSYNIAAATGWNPGASSSPADPSGNIITVSNVTTPTLSSATYEPGTGLLSVTGTNLPAYPGVNNDLDVSKFTITGGSGSTYTLTSSDVELTSSTSASISLNSTDQVNLASLLDRKGLLSSTGTPYNIAAADDWAIGANPNSDIADPSENPITVGNHAPTLSPINPAIIQDSSETASPTPTLTGTLAASDADDDTLSFSITGGEETGNISTRIGSYGTLTLHPSSGAYTYTTDPAAIKPLGADATVNDNFTLSARDSDNASVNTPLSITITGVNDPPTLNAPITGSITETADTTGSTTSALSGTLIASDVDAGDSLTYGIDGGSVEGSASVKTGIYGRLTVNQATGVYAYSPDAEAIERLRAGQAESESFTFTATDSNNATATTIYTINLTGANDAPVLITPVAGSIAELEQSSQTASSGLSGTLIASDVDGGDSLTYGIDGGLVDGSASVKTGIYGSLRVNQATGVYTYSPDSEAIERLRAGQAESESFTFTATDSNNATATTIYTINLTGANDAPVLITPVAGSIAELEQSSQTASSGLSGTLIASDVDGGDSLTYGIDGGLVDGSASVKAGIYGRLRVNQATGVYTYSPDSEAIELLNPGDTPSESFSLIATDSNNATATTIYTINLTGAAEASPSRGSSNTSEPQSSEPDAITSEPSPASDLVSESTPETPNTAPAPTLQPAPVSQPTREERDRTVVQQLGPYISVSHSSGITLSVERDTTSEQANAFLNQLPSTAEVHFYSLSTTCTCSVKTADHAIAIEGASSSSSASAEDNANGETTPIKVLVVDFTQLEGVTDLQLNNIDFVVIEGRASIRGGEGANIVRADAFSQFIKLGADDDTLDGGGGNDTVASRAGDDLLIGGAGHDHGHGGKDHDTLRGKTGRDVLSGGRGHDRLSGGRGADQLSGQRGHDHLRGKHGNDSLDGGAGNDTLIGGAGADSFTMSRGKDVIADFNISEGDAIMISDDLDLNLTISQSGDHLLLIDESQDVRTKLMHVNRDEFIAAFPELL